MTKLLALLQREPAAVGHLLTSLLPALVLFGILSLDATSITALVVAVNAVVAFGVRLRVTPVCPAPSAAPQPVDG